jgi:SsrA-binding protein
MHIAEFIGGNKHYNHNPLRDKKLLMKKKEIIKLNDSLGQKGLTIVPLDVFISNNSFVKITIGLGRGKHVYDKRLQLKIKTLEKEAKLRD